MSFNFEWPTFSDDFYADAKEMLAAVSRPNLVHDFAWSAGIVAEQRTVVTTCTWWTTDD